MSGSRIGLPPQDRDYDRDSDEIEDNSDYDIDDDSNGLLPSSGGISPVVIHSGLWHIQTKTFTVMTIRTKRMKKATMKVRL